MQKEKIDFLVEIARGAIATHARQKYDQPISDAEVKAIDTAFGKDTAATLMEFIKFQRKDGIFEIRGNTEKGNAARYTPQDGKKLDLLERHQFAASIIPAFVLHKLKKHEAQVATVSESALALAVTRFAEKSYLTLMRTNLKLDVSEEKLEEQLRNIKINGKPMLKDAFEIELEAAKNPKPFKLSTLHTARILLEEKLRAAVDASKGR